MYPADLNLTDWTNQHGQWGGCEVIKSSANTIPDSGEPVMDALHYSFSQMKRESEHNFLEYAANIKATVKSSDLYLLHKLFGYLTSRTTSPAVIWCHWFHHVKRANRISHFQVSGNRIHSIGVRNPESQYRLPWPYCNCD